MNMLLLGYSLSAFFGLIFLSIKFPHQMANSLMFKNFKDSKELIFSLLMWSFVICSIWLMFTVVMSLLIIGAIK